MKQRRLELRPKETTSIRNENMVIDNGVVRDGVSITPNTPAFGGAALGGNVLKPS